MNIAKIMIPRACTVFLNEKQTVRQGWEVMTRNGYTAIPVIDGEHHYIGCVSEGDFLRHIMDVGSTNMKDYEKYKIADIMRCDFCPPLTIMASVEDVVEQSQQQNFVPIVDSRNALCGILTRRGVIAHLAEKNGIPSKV